ncbi:MAG: carboxylesterase [Porticoccaceae bacterium]|nr:carboxylesterase [Porticoccaceae bacterium]
MWMQCLYRKIKHFYIKKEINRLNTTTLCWFFIITLFIQGCTLSMREPSNILIQTSGGLVSGSESSIGGKSFTTWLDIPYAQPPLNDLRWRAPRALDQTSNRIIPPEVTFCVQESSTYGAVQGDGIVGSEDCLYLDIRSPVNVSNELLPVMVWIHGGGNVTGSKDYYDFSRLVVEEKVVVVSINYRLGALGWFTHPAIQKFQTGDDQSSNFGTLDIIQALNWIKQNIDKFGGNSENVTIFGESAGGHNVLTLLVAPNTKGLFHKAIVQSGYTSSASLESAYNKHALDPFVNRGSWQMTRNLFPYSQSILFDSQEGREQLSVIRNSLRALDARDFIGAYVEYRDEDYMPLTTSDGIVIPIEGLEKALKNPKYKKDVSVIVGSTKDELSFWLGTHRYFVEEYHPYTRLLPKGLRLKDKNLYKFWRKIRSHAWKLRGVDHVLNALEIAGYKSLYAYRFDWDDQKSSMFADIPEIMGAAHATDVAFLTGRYIYGPIGSYMYPKSRSRDQMERTMMMAWSDFARFGSPNKRLPLNWEKYSQGRGDFLKLDKDEDLKMGSETETMDSLLKKVADSVFLGPIQKCLLVWESLVNIGDPDINRYNVWEDGVCSAYDITLERKRISAQLKREHGGTSVFE